MLPRKLLKVQQLAGTVIHLKPVQVFYQVKNRLVKPAYVALEEPGVRCPRLKTVPVPRYKCLDGERFSFLNLEHEFAGWDFNEYGNLWTYNQNYFDWLNQEGMGADEGCRWIDRFIEDLPTGGFAFDPYPIALRCINWLKFFCRYPECATKERLDPLYSQLRLLERKLEYHLLANHLLEDAFALYVGAVYFCDIGLQTKACRLLLRQLDEQILPDGAHYEQSPMYHCILLDRLLDCINMGGPVVASLREYATRMLGHLASVRWSDGSIPLLNDAAYGIAPTPAQLSDYAGRLGLRWEAIPMKDCGYRKLQAGRMEAIVDVGNIAATYQPGHTHADSLTYELRVDGKPFVVDTGISTYNKDARRQLERSSAAHNVVVVDGKDSSEVWGGFRVGKRCHVNLVEDTGNVIVAEHDGFGKPCRRTIRMENGGFVVEDQYDGEAVSYIHLAADAEGIKVEGATDVQIRPWKYSTEYNRFHEGKVVEIRFKGRVSYSIV